VSVVFKEGWRLLRDEQFFRFWLDPRLSVGDIPKYWEVGMLLQELVVEDVGNRGPPPGVNL